MGRKRKRHSSDHSSPNAAGKLIKSIESNSSEANKRLHSYPVLRLYYSHVSSLRDYLLYKLPLSSRASRRKINSLTRSVPANGEDDLAPLCTLLDSVVIGYFHNNNESIEDLRQNELTQFSQSHLNHTVGATSRNPAFTQSEIVEYVISTLFTKTFEHLQGNWKKPPHPLCHGYSPCAGNGYSVTEPHFPNQNVATLKSSPWSEVPSLLGSKGPGIMLSLLLDCGIYVPVNGSCKNLCQLSGILLSEMPLLHQGHKTGLSYTPHDVAKREAKDCSTASSPGTIVFSRSRMFYARPALKGEGQIRFGLIRAHVLNRCSNAGDPRHTVHIMKHIFPRQFGLHNTFTCLAQNSLNDYTNRDLEISEADNSRELRKTPKPGSSKGRPLNVPKRLRRHAYGLVKDLQKRHGQCPYTELLKHYCPAHDIQNRWTTFHPISHESSSASIESSSFVTQTIKTTEIPSIQQSMALTNHIHSDVPMMEYATPSASVSAFCRAVLRRLIPPLFFGRGEQGLKNQQSVLRSVDQFIRLRRKESFSLHEASQGLKTFSIEWLFLRKSDPKSKSSKLDTAKQAELLQEFLFYVIESLLVPLVRSNFYVTESGVNSNRLFYFRHDTWRSISEPSLTSLKLSMLEELPKNKVERQLNSRSLGFSNLRLLPKARGARPIINFKRPNSRNVKGKSINKLLEPVYNMLTYEKNTQPHRLGSSLFSQGDMYPRLKAYKLQLKAGGNREAPLYFVKVDVKSCFDTIPQRELVRFVRQLTSEESYRMSRYAVIRPPANRFEECHPEELKPLKMWKSRAQALDDFSSFLDSVNEELGTTRKGAVFLEYGNYHPRDTGGLIRLMDQHVKVNLVKIGQRYYRQKCGIPQGSILSSILCNFFYADMEREKLDFLTEESLLLRQTDDFLLITTNRHQARRFLQSMHDGHPEYGISVNPAKTLVNFEVAINGMKVARLCGSSDFPYLGDFIGTRTLTVSTDSDRKKRNAISDSLTVELSKAPGKTFTRKVLGAFKIQTHARFLDTAFNTVPAVMSNIYQNFVMAAMKFYRYIKCLPTAKQPHVLLIIKTIQDLMWLAYNLIKSMKTELAPKGYECAVSKTQIQWLASKAFLSVLGRKQSKFQPVVLWLKQKVKANKQMTGGNATKLRKAVRIGATAYQDFRY